MGIGRREFLVQFGGALAALTSVSRAAGAVEDLYVNGRHGIAFVKPSRWTFEDLREIRRTKAGMLLDFESFEPADWAEYLASDQRHAAFVVAADAARARHLPNPDVADGVRVAPGVSVAFEGTWEEDGPDPSQDVHLLAFVERDLSLFRQSYGRFRLLQGPRVTSVSGSEAVEYVAKYRVRHAALPRGVPMRERVIYIYQGPAIYSVRMFDYPELAPPLEFDFDQFVLTLRIL